MNYKYILVFAFVFILFGFQVQNRMPTHALYLSVIHIDYAKLDSTASIKMRVFADDLVNVLKNEYGVGKIVDSPSFCQTFNANLELYFNAHFQCLINEKAYPLSLKNCERLEEVYQLEFLMDCPADWQATSINADLFMELFPTQSNIIKIQYLEHKRFGRSVRGKETLFFNF
jgi:hypothetical protein